MDHMRQPADHTSNDTRTTTAVHRTPNFQLRLHLVRHGETIANLQENVIGQSDSPLTELGKAQVRALGKWLASSATSSTTNQRGSKDDDAGHENRRTFFWRIYSSDLGRTSATTRLLLQEYDVVSNNPCVPPGQSLGQNERTDDYNVRYDHRLREIARGLRQGLPKNYTHEEAVAIYKNGQHPLYSNTVVDVTTSPTSFPALETDDDGWNRMYTSWLKELIQDISTLHHETDSSPYNVLVVTHAALLRVFLQRILHPDQLQQHPEVVYKYDNNDTGIPINNRLHVPNTSITILHLDIAMPPSPLLLVTAPIHDPNNDPQRHDDSISTPIIQRIDIERFTSTDHFQYIV